MDKVSFGKAAGTEVTVLSDTEATVKVPAKSADDKYAAGKLTGAFGVKGENTHGATAKPKALAYSALPTVTGGDKTASKFDVKTVKLTLAGTNLTGASVKFGTKAGTVDKAASNADKLVVTVPVGASESTVDVVVKTAVGEVKLGQKWAYKATTPVDAAWPVAPVDPPADPEVP
jgi:hypothetical protein